MSGLNINRRQSIKYVNDEDSPLLLTFNSLEKGDLEEGCTKSNSFMYNSEEDVYRLNSYKRSRITERVNSNLEQIDEETENNYQELKEEQNIFSNLMNKNKKYILFGIVFTYLIFCLIEIIFGYISKSLTLMADAIFYFSEGFCFAIYIIILNISINVPKINRTYGFYIGEILVILVRAVLLFGLSFWLFYYTFLRFKQYQASNGLIIIIIGIISTLFNIIVGLMKIFLGINSDISIFEKENKISGNDLKYNNLKDSFINLIYKLIQNGIIIIAGILIFFIPSAFYIDPSFSTLFILILLYKAFNHIKRIIKILMNGAICKIDLNELKHDLKSIQGVIKVNNLYLWSLNEKNISMSCQLICSEPQNTLSLARELVKQKYNIIHTTFEVGLNDDNLKE